MFYNKKVTAELLIVNEFNSKKNTSSQRLLRTSKYFCVVSILEFFQTNFKIHIVLLSISENVKTL